MDVPFLITTSRLIVQPLTISDDAFILELVNTEGWLTFIGNRNITSIIEARAYIQKILENGNISYWVVTLKENQTPVGIVTFIKRAYLEHHDIGFAFLPRFTKKGYAYEATTAVLNQLLQQGNYAHVLATTVPGNINSITLLKKIGFIFEKEMKVETETLQVYGIATGTWER